MSRKSSEASNDNIPLDNIYQSEEVFIPPQNPNHNTNILELIKIKEDGSPIDLKKIQEKCYHGLDECPPEERVYAWLILTQVFPLQPEEWEQLKKDRTTQYFDYVDLFKMTGYEEKFFPNTAETTNFGVSNNDLMELIHGDVIRTSHHIQFLPFPDQDAPEPESEEDILMPYHEQIRRIERILYIFASLNRTISYLQGFNELCTVLYYAYSSALSVFDDQKDMMEAFVFYSFQSLLASTKLNELFTTQDKSSLIHNRMAEFMQILKRHRPKTYKIIRKHDIHPLCFCFRWLNMLFAQDYMMPSLMLIWDSLMAHFHELVDYANYIAVAQVKMTEHTLDPNDYVQTITSLQRNIAENIQPLLFWAKKYWDEDHEGGKKSILSLFKKLL
ncbi:TBC1 domain protein [Tritrichomonas foetus]|uniref:TBC1 domain protein n=1 Tax=Tritrichomonas foetus TaxID=1144522 RepID=A0A1J4KR09_9EUKA|nr:TBC1 domain protein [Tritrichomonas foetus]|eukprot:OHT13538.1 TBC1 domain protein [Tritrichomonas foetus]